MSNYKYKILGAPSVTFVENGDVIKKFNPQYGFETVCLEKFDAIAYLTQFQDIEKTILDNIRNGPNNLVEFRVSEYTALKD